MICFNCHNELLGSEAFCTKCGVNLNNAINLTLRRPGKFFGCAVKLDISINGIKYKLGAGEVLNVIVPTGNCTIRFDFWCRREKEVFLNIEPGKKYDVVFKYDALLGGFKIAKESKLN